MFIKFEPKKVNGRRITSQDDIEAAKKISGQILIDIFREYLESQIKIPAMESTSKELILRINLLKDSGNYNFEKSKIT